MILRKTLKKTCRTQFFNNPGYSDNLLTINVLWYNPPFPSKNRTQNPLTFQFLFRYTFKAENYIFLNISAEANCLFLHSPLQFSFQRAVFIFSAHSERIFSALKIKLQCAVKKKTARWKFENLVVFFQKLFAGDK